MTGNQKLALGCGCCALLGIVIAVIIGVVVYLHWGDSDQVKYPERNDVEEIDGVSSSETDEFEGEEIVSVSGTDAESVSDNPRDDGYSPSRYAIKAGSDGGKWSTLQSGETVYEYPASGQYARSVWINDGGKLYYVDASGCKMQSNYAHDGYFAGADGLLDESKPRITENVLPSQGVYSDGSVRWRFNLSTSSDGVISGTATQTYSGNGRTETYRVTSFGSSAYRLVYTKDEQMQAHVVVVQGGRRIVVSCGGTTDSYELQ